MLICKSIELQIIPITPKMIMHTIASKSEKALCDWRYVGISVEHWVYKIVMFQVWRESCSFVLKLHRQDEVENTD